MIARKIREAVRHAGRAMMHPAVAPAPLREVPWGLGATTVPGSAGTQALRAAFQTRSHSSTAHLGWRRLLQQGQEHLDAGRLTDAQVYLEHAEFLAGSQPAVRGAMMALKVRLDAHSYENLLRRAACYEAEGHTLEAVCALRSAHDLRPSQALRNRIKHLED